MGKSDKETDLDTVGKSNKEIDLHMYTTGPVDGICSPAMTPPIVHYAYKQLGVQLCSCLNAAAL